MKRGICLIALVMACLLVLAGCGCEHEWAEANCTTPKTCKLCGETEGEPLGHTWVDADCDTPKTCSVCGETEGEALGHTWIDATCTEPKTCSVCGATEGEALGHTWTEATTEAPKTCSVCGETEGERIITDPRFTSAAAAPVVGTWYCEISMTGEDMGLEDFPDEVATRETFDFGRDGTLTYTIEIVDLEAYMASMKTYTMDSIYNELATEGMNREEADAAMVEICGMTVEEYVDAVLSALDEESLTTVLDMVYYVEGNQIYLGLSWDDEMEPSEYRIEDGTMHLMDSEFDELELKPVTE